MIIDLYDLENNRPKIMEEIFRQVKLLVKATTENKFDVLELGFTIKKLKNKDEDYI